MRREHRRVGRNGQAVGLFSKRTPEEREAARSLADSYDLAAFGIRQLKEQPLRGEDLVETLGIANGEMLIAVEQIALLPPSKYRTELGARAVSRAVTVHAHCLAAAETGGLDRDRLHDATQRYADESSARRGLARPAPSLIQALAEGR